MIKNKERGLSGITILILVLIVAVIIILTIIFLPKGKPKTQSPNIPSYSPSPSQNTASFTPVNLTQNQMTKIGTTTQNQVRY